MFQNSFEMHFKMFFFFFFLISPLNFHMEGHESYFGVFLLSLSFSSKMLWACHVT